MLSPRSSGMFCGDELPDVMGQIEDLVADRRGHRRQLTTDGVYAGTHAVIVWRLPRPRAADNPPGGRRPRDAATSDRRIEPARGWRCYAWSTTTDGMSVPCSVVAPCRERCTE